MIETLTTLDSFKQALDKKEGKEFDLLGLLSLIEHEPDNHSARLLLAQFFWANELKTFAAKELQVVYEKNRENQSVVRLLDELGIARVSTDEAQGIAEAEISEILFED